jgi:hypothetical protein
MDSDRTDSPKFSSARRRWQAIFTDLHFWIPLAVLAGGFLLLDKLR